MSDEDKLFALTLAALSNSALTGSINPASIASRCIATAQETLKQLKVIA